MLLISHIYTAIQLKKIANPEDEGVYYLTSILPDIRYTASIKRESTHIHLSQLKNIFKESSDKYKGYYLHLLIDEHMGEWDFLDKLKRQYPKLIQKVLRASLLNVIIEIYCLEQIKKLPTIILSKKYDNDYKKLGINADDFDSYYLSVQLILNGLSIESIENVLLHDEKFKNVQKVQFYKDIGKFITRNQLVKRYLISKVDKIYTSFVSELATKYIKQFPYETAQSIPSRTIKRIRE